MITVVSFEPISGLFSLSMVFHGAILAKVDLTLSVFYLGFSMCPVWMNDQASGDVFQLHDKVSIYRLLAWISRGYLCAKPLSDLHSP